MIGYKRLEDLHPYVRNKAEDLLVLCSMEKIELAIVCGYRSIEEQDRLYSQGRTIPGNIVTNARGGRSFHNHRAAFDVCPVEDGKLNWNSNKWDRVGELGERIGLEWGGRFKSIIDKPHFQYTQGISIDDFQAGKTLGKILRVAIVENEMPKENLPGLFIPNMMPKNQGTYQHATRVYEVFKQKAIEKLEVYLVPSSNYAFKWIKKNDIQIVTMSLSNAIASDSIEKEISKTSFIICAAGNSGDKGESISSKNEWWCSVGAIDQDKKLMPYSSYGLGAVDYVQYAGQETSLGVFHGTSAAAPAFAAELTHFYKEYFEFYRDWPTIEEAYKHINNNVIDVEAHGDDIKSGKGLYLYKEEKFPFKDVMFNSWYYDSIKELYERGLIKGYVDQTFKPDQPITRGEMASLLNKLI